MFCTASLQVFKEEECWNTRGHNRQYLQSALIINRFFIFGSVVIISWNAIKIFFIFFCSVLSRIVDEIRWPRGPVLSTLPELMIGAISTSCAKKQTHLKALILNRPVTNLLPYCKAGRPNPSSSCSHDAFCSATLLSYASSPIQVLLHQSWHDNVVCSPTAACWSNDGQRTEAHKKRLSQHGRRMSLGAKHDRVDVAI